MLLDATTFELVSRFDEVADAARRRAARRPCASGADAEHARGGLGRVPQRRRAAQRPRDACGAASRRPSSRSACGSPAPARTRSRARRISASRRATATAGSSSSSSTSRAASSCSGCTCTSPCPIPTSRCTSWRACSRSCPCCSRSRPARRSGAARPRASPRRARRSSRACRAPGQPPRFSSYDDYLEMVGTMEEAGVIDDYTYLWWDVRPHPRLGTVEIRVMDVQFDIDQTLMLAAYMQASVARAIDEARLGAPADRPTTASSCPRTSGRGALRPRRPADGSGRRSAHAAARHGARAAQRRAARAVRARARLRGRAGRDRAHDLVGQRRDAHDARLQRQPRHDRAHARARTRDRAPLRRAAQHVRELRAALRGRGTRV